ncbi:hypothetical protein SAMN05421539_11838 [Jannaschia seohaensis]|uniref:Uncharacterized protein n=1 Tax=Jannaschia seohaensis TaxID=475081 RepID=A0A2Y9B8H2_9RHOB|nr:hypothetical protein BCF38_11838 [Jannaschia seohaensis]SSA51287.1 hypothetical protein SAMN05421539_11838 [Jannaschia seohaensis]
MTFAFVAEHRPIGPVRGRGEVLGVSRSEVYV